MRILFLGTPAIAATCLESLAASHHTVVGVLTHPDKPQGRGLKLQPTPVKETALRLGLPVLEVPDCKDPELPARIREFGADLLVVVAFVVLPNAVLDAAPLGAVNLHGSLLPRWRGAAPVQRAIAAGDTETGATVFRLDSGVDTGGIVLQERLPIGPDDTSLDILTRLGTLGGPLLARAIDLLEADPANPGVRQDASLATRAPKLFPEEGKLDWSVDASFLHNKVRAFHPAPGCWALYQGVRLKIWRTRVSESVASGAVGSVVRGPDGTPLVVCGTGCLELLEVQPEGRKRLSGRDWQNGWRAGDEIALS